MAVATSVCAATAGDGRSQPLATQTSAISCPESARLPSASSAAQTAMSFSSRESSSRSDADERSPSGAVDGASGNGGGGKGITLVDLFDRVAWDEVGVESAVNVEVSGLARLGADVDEPEARAARDEADEGEAATFEWDVVSAAALAAVDIFPRPWSPAAFRAAGGAAGATPCTRAA